MPNQIRLWNGMIIYRFGGEDLAERVGRVVSHRNGACCNNGVE